MKNFFSLDKNCVVTLLFCWLKDSSNWR